MALASLNSGSVVSVAMSFRFGLNYSEAAMKVWLFLLHLDTRSLRS